MAVMTEEWRDIAGYEGSYQVSSLGRVRSLDRISHNGKRLSGRILATPASYKGYLQLNLYRNGKSTMFEAHRLVALTFLPNPDKKPHVNHKDGNKSNNTTSNLEWATISENVAHAIRTGLNHAPPIRCGEANPSCKLSDDEVLAIRILRNEHEMPYTKIGRMFGVCAQTVWNIVKMESRTKGSEVRARS